MSTLKEVTNRVSTTLMTDGVNSSEWATYCQMLVELTTVKAQLLQDEATKSQINVCNAYIRLVRTVINACTRTV